MALLLIAIAVFMMICTEYGYECALPNGGYFRIKWDPKKKQFDHFYWRPKTNIKPLPKDTIYLESEKKEEKSKPSGL